ncbi:hypothetical protein DL93DRAFT_1519543 [Clavulina sp. PMI_390]|nr:hypothetical protein DL93DRAFT_1519543 [Clavulina sp. PMI_390]
MKKKPMLDKMKAAIKAHNETHTNASSKPLLSLRDFYQNSGFVPPFPVETHATYYDRDAVLSINMNNLVQIPDIESSPSPSTESVESPVITHARAAPVTSSVHSSEETTCGASAAVNDVSAPLDFSSFTFPSPPLRAREFDAEAPIGVPALLFSGMDVQVAAAPLAPPARTDSTKGSGTSAFLGPYYDSLSTANVPAIINSASLSFEDHLPTTAQPPFGAVHDQENQFFFQQFPPMQAQLTIPDMSFVQYPAPYAPPMPAMPPPTPPPNDLPVQAEATTNPITAFSQVLAGWNGVVRPFSHRYQTELDPLDIANFVRGGGDNCMLQASYSASSTQRL